jgi:uncharacterized protein (UPF0276 family)
MVGIGYRKDFGEEFLTSPIKPSFIEVAPENWIGVGGYWKKLFDQATEKYPLYAHGLSLSIGSPDNLDMKFLSQVKKFLNENNVQVYSEHLSYSKCDNAHLYDLLPIPFTEEAVRHVAKRIKTVEDCLERPVVMEIVSYYTEIAPEMTEIEFINSVVQESGCKLLLDVNNIYVNGFNHLYNPYDFINQVDLSKVEYIHMAGHEKVASDLIIDTHGQAIIDPVYDLFEFTMNRVARDVPVLLERDFNIPELEELQREMNTLSEIKSKSLKQREYAS